MNYTESDSNEHMAEALEGLKVNRMREHRGRKEVNMTLEFQSYKANSVSLQNGKEGQRREGNNIIVCFHLVCDLTHRENKSLSFVRNQKKSVSSRKCAIGSSR